MADVQSVDLARPVKVIVASTVANADVVHVVMPSPIGVCAKHVAGRAGVPVTAGFHVQPENITYNLHLANARRLADRTYQILWRAFYHDVSHIHAPSEFIAEQLRFHGYRQHLHVISSGVPPQFCPGPPRETWTLDSSDPATIMTVGRLSPEKRIEVLIDAVARSRHRDRIHLVVDGRGTTRRHRPGAWPIAGRIPVGQGQMVVHLPHQRTHRCHCTRPGHAHPVTLDSRRRP